MAENDSQHVSVCPPGRYQPEVGGPLGCRPCPPHSSAPTSGLSSCRCDAGYYRSATDPNWSPCSRPPSAPLNLSVSFVDQAAVALEWHAPIDAGGRQDLGYRVECDVCLSSATYRPPGFADGGIGNETRVTIAGLRPVTKYRFRVYAVNGVSEFLADDRQQFLDITVTTEAAVPSMVSNVHVAEVKPSQMVLAWDPPRDQFGQNVETYEVRYFPRGEERDYVSQTTKRQQLTVLKLQQQTEYGFQVRAKTPHGWGEFSPTVYRSTGQIFVYVGEKEGTGSRIVIGTLAAASVVVFLVAVILLVLRYRRRSRSAECGKEKQPGNGETLEYRSNEGHLVTYHKLYANGTLGKMVCQQENPQIITTHTSNMTTPLFTQVGPPRTYVDPHNYEDPHQAVKDFAREIDASCITIEAIIGGEFLPHQNPLAPDVPDMTKFSCVEEWLASIRMSRYLENFERAGVTSMEAVMRLSPQDLAVVGVALVGHQKKILNSVQTMRAQVSINVSDGFLV
ncbi:unnamed protein product [Notodromas monacha]|uniref:Uncharacterized protein n=1 Tax=Notodromas monacha TaxID=399045 RepID=A0A7R9BP41_9CRUS|nr:unnamed protein product [Notodromas monacha]CAG0917576.1 unnamed protein product [Notodromas monacha]